MLTTRTEIARSTASTSAPAHVDAGGTGEPDDRARFAAHAIGYDDVEAGRAAAVSYPVTRLSLVKYCGASGDFNVIHWNERIARSVGLPNVIAHGMFTMAQAGRYVTDWAGAAGAVSRVRRPVLRPGASSPTTTPARRSRSAARSRRSWTATWWRWR